MHQEKNSIPETIKTEGQVEDGFERYKELYQYSTDILLREHERFNRADEKAATYSTMFFFLIGGVAYYDKWIFDRLHWPCNILNLFLDFPLIAIGLLALGLSFLGLILAQHTIRIRPIVSRPLNQAMLDFFENQSLVTIYYGLARENSNAYAKNRTATDAKYTLLKWSYFVMVAVFVLLALLTAIYIACIFAAKMHISLCYGQN